VLEFILGNKKPAGANSGGRQKGFVRSGVSRPKLSGLVREDRQSKEEL
jgi:hypothetical protein